MSYINVGVPLPDQQKKYGTEPRIQLNDQISEVNDIITFVELERNQRSEADRPYITTAIKADKQVRMGMVSDIKQELRKAGALKIFYNASKGGKRK